MAIIIGEGGPNDRAAIPLATRRGTWIPNEQRLERAPASLRAAVEIWTGKYPEIQLRSATALYNCIGLVFASRRTLIDPKYLVTILQEDEYRQVAGSQDLQLGDIVVYRRRSDQSVSHVAVIFAVERKIATASWEIWVISQWGGDGEYLHRMEDVPLDFLGEPTEYWTDRRPCP